MIYIQKIASVNHLQPESVDVKALCREVSAKFVRRTDRFIQLGILGVAQIQQKQKIDENTALYLTSGQGNISVFKRLCDYRFIEKSPPKPVDFINSLSNTAGFYIAQFLELNSKNINIYHHGFAVEMALILADCDLTQNNEQQVLIGGVDQAFEPAEIAKRYLGLKPDVKLGEGSNWMLLSNSKENALASINVITQKMNADQLKHFVCNISKDTQIAFALRCPDTLIVELMTECSLSRFCYETQVCFYETVVLFALNTFVQTEKGKLIYIDYFEDSFRLIELNVF